MEVFTLTRYMHCGEVRRERMPSLKVLRDL